MPPETTHAERRVHIVGAGPVGLMLTALLQTTGTFSIRLYEKRREYTRTRMVKLDSYLVADSVESYCIDRIDGENVEAVFDRTELDEGLAFRRSIPSDLKALLRSWTLGFCPLNAIERSLSDLIDVRASNSVERIAAAVTAEKAMAMLKPEDILIDCTGSNSLLRDHVAPRRRGWWVEAPIRSRSGLNTRSSSHSCIARRISATSIASITKTPRTTATSSFQRSTAPTTTKV